MPDMAISVDKWHVFGNAKYRASTRSLLGEYDMYVIWMLALYWITSDVGCGFSYYTMDWNVTVLFGWDNTVPMEMRSGQVKRVCHKSTVFDIFINIFDIILFQSGCVVWWNWKVIKDFWLRSHYCVCVFLTKGISSLCSVDKYSERRVPELHI